MTNLEMLRDKIEALQLSPVVVAAAMGVSLPTYYKRMDGDGEFTARMIVGLRKVLHLTRDERDLIFFNEKCE